MAKLSFEMPEDFTAQLSRMANIDEIAPKMIDAALPTLVNRVKNGLSFHIISGSLYKSIKAKKAKKTKSGGYYGSVTAVGTDKNGVRNAEKLVYLEYGTSEQSATPVLAKAVNDSEEEVQTIMQEVFNREVGD